MRKPIALTANEAKIADTARNALAGVENGSGVMVTFQKADKSLRTLAGTKVEVSGVGDKEIVKVETVDGFRSANLHRIIGVTAL